MSLFCPAYVDTSNWEFPDVCRYYFGKFGQWSSLVFSMVSLIGAMVIYWVLMSNFLYNSGQFIYSESSFNCKKKVSHFSWHMLHFRKCFIPNTRLAQSSSHRHSRGPVEEGLQRPLVQVGLSICGGRHGYRCRYRGGREPTGRNQQLLLCGDVSES